MGIIIWDSHRGVLVCQSSLVYYRSDPFLAKCKALWRAIQFCDELGLERVQMEGDAKVVIDFVLKNENCSNWCGTLIDDVTSFLTSRPIWSLDFVHREMNNIAHLLAKFGLSLDEKRVWRQDHSTVITSIVLVEQIP